MLAIWIASVKNSRTALGGASGYYIVGLVAPDRLLVASFDDCYGVVFRRFAVFDSQTSRMLFRHSYAPGADLKISSNGHIVMEQDGPEVHLFRLL
jgi:hypothetical protein